MPVLDVHGGARGAAGRAASSDTPQADAEALSVAVMNALHWDFAVPRHRVRVHCENGWVTLTGDVGSVQASVAAGRAVIAEAGVLVSAVVISRPHPDVYREVI